MIFLNSIWLFALAALSIPVAIHLWNIRRGKTLKVGNISLITASSQNSRSLKLHDLLLLLLRCLLLALVSLVLAVPLWQKYINTSAIKGWVLLPKQDLKESYKKFRPKIDSLTKVGYEFHYFNCDFEKTDLVKALADTTNAKNITSISYWSLVQQLDEKVRSSLPIYLFTPNKLTDFSGTKPQVTINLHWQTYTPADSTAAWIEKAWLTNNNDIRIIEGNSKPSGIYFKNYTIHSGDQQTPFIIHTENGKLSAGLKSSDRLVDVDASSWRFAIYAERNNPDAEYIKSALTAIAQLTGHKAVIKQYADADQIPKHQNWIFWLSVKPLSKDLNGDNLLAYTTGKVKETNTWISGEMESLSKSKIALYKLIVAPNKDEYLIWHDGFGNPVLGLQKNGQTNYYHFYSRFDPAWSNLVWSDDFPKLLLKLVAGTFTNIDSKYDRRMIDVRQMLPVFNKEEHVTVNKITGQNDLSHYLWLFLVITLAIERWLSHQKSAKQIVSNG